MSRLTDARDIVRDRATDLADRAWFHLTPSGRRTQRELAAMTQDRSIHPSVRVSSVEWTPATADPLEPLPFNVADVRQEIEDARLARAYGETSLLDSWAGPWPPAEPAIVPPALPTYEEARERLSATYRAIVADWSIVNGPIPSGPALSDLAWSRLSHADRWVLDRDRYTAEEDAR